MPLRETLPVGAGTAQWSVWSTVARVVVTDPAALPLATELVERRLAEVDAACSRFRPDAELSRVGSLPTPVSPLLAALVDVALAAAAATDGDVDPTLGGALSALGYDRDFGAVRAGKVSVVPAADWRAVRLRDGELSVPAGVRLDLGATAKAWTADTCAADVAARCGTGVLVALGGDIGTAGPAPRGGWEVRVQDGPGEPVDIVTLPAGAGLATSSTRSRRWRNADELLHHILDPATRRSALPVWRTVTVASTSCLRANTFSTAAVVRGHRAPAWLAAAGVPARLVAAGGTVTAMGGWPRDGYGR